MILVLAQKNSPRLQYTMEVLLQQHAGIPFLITTNKEEFLLSDHDKIHYGEECIPGCLNIKPCGLLYEETIHPQDITIISYQGIPGLFPTDASLPFDLFSAAFYMLSRYEEYLPFEADRHGRFPVTASLAYRQGLLKTAVVDHWLRLLLPHRPLKSYPPFVPSIDIDVAYAYKHKGLARALGGFARGLVQANGPDILARAAALCGLKQDPYDTYDYIRQQHEMAGLKPYFFILMRDRGPYDKNISHLKPAFRELIKTLARDGNVGLHPSYASYSEPGLLEKEAGRLSEILSQKVTRSRQHFLRLSFPTTYRNLIRVGIQEDHSLGFAESPGFRAGTSKPFTFYDLEKEAHTALTLHPFTLMDGSLKDYLKLDAPGSALVIKELIAETRKAGGSFTSLWHNETFCESKRWRGWRGIYAAMLAEATNPVTS